MFEHMGKDKPLVFSRPPFWSELNEKGEEQFNSLPGWQRHLVKRLMTHGDLARAAQESGVSRHVKDHVDIDKAEGKSIVEALNHGGIDARYLVDKLKQCMDGVSVRFDKHGNPVEFEDLNLKLKTVELVCKLRGDFMVDPKKKTNNGIEELFSDLDVGDDGKRQIKSDSPQS